MVYEGGVRDNIGTCWIIGWVPRGDVAGEADVVNIALFDEVREAFCL